MVNRILATLIFALYLPAGQALAQIAPANPNVQFESDEEVLVTDNFKIKEEETDPLQRLISIPIYKKQYDACEKVRGNSTSFDMGDCMWNGTADGQVQGLSQAGREKAQKFMEYSASQGDGRTPASKDANKKYEGVDLNRFKSGKKDKAIQKIEDYFADKLKNYLYGEVKADAERQKIKIVNHTTFYDLFQNRLSKNIVEAMSSICMEAEILTVTNATDHTVDDKGANVESPIRLFLVPSTEAKRQKVRANNLSLLKEVKDDGQGTISNKASNNWNACIGSIEQMCLGHKEYCASEHNCPSKTKQVFSSGECSKFSGAKETSCSSDITYTKGRACTVTNYLKNARQSLFAISKVQDQWKKLGDDKATSIAFSTCSEVDARTGKCTKKLEVSNYDQDDKEEGIDKVNTLSSNETITASGFDKEQESIVEQMKQCQEGDDEVCKKFIAKDKKKKLEELAEMELRSKAMEEKLKSDEFAEEEVKKYLTEQGYDESQISEQLSDTEKLDKLKKEILSKYENERKNLIAHLRDKIEKTTIEGDFDRTKHKDILDNIAGEIEGKTKRFAQLVHFNNIVSGYLQVGEGEGAKRNTASLYTELNDTQETIYGEANKEMLDSIKDVAQQAGLSENDSNEGTSQLGVDELNEEILDYDNLGQ